MRRLMGHLARVAPLVAAAALATGCGNNELDQRSVLEEYRVLAILADKPQPAPDDTVTLSVIEHDPADLDPAAPTGEPFYVWEICPFSLGSLTGYACFDPFESIGGAGMMMNPDMLPPDVQARLPQLIADLAELGVSIDDLPTAFTPRYVRTQLPVLTLEMDEVGGVGVEALVVICAAVSPDGVCRNRGNEEVTLEQGWDVFVKLYSGREGVRRLDTVKVLKVRDFEGRNRNNPGVRQLDLSAPSGGAPVLQPEQAVLFTVTLGDDAIESYPEIQIDTDGAIRRAADGTPITETVDEDLILSWYSTSGEFEFTRTADGAFENTLTLPEDPGPVRIYVVARDGRGGFGFISTEITVEGPTE